MTISLFRQSFYRQFSATLKQLTEAARSQSGQEVADGTTHDWMPTIAALQTEFQSTILAATDVEVAELNGRIRAIETEIFRVLKLLSTDFLFLKSAKQASTLRLRHQQFCDRLTAAHTYSRSLLTLDSKDENIDDPDRDDNDHPGPTAPAPGVPR